MEPPAGRVAGEHGVTLLIEGQDYVDVVFVTTQPRSDWTFTEMQIINTADDAPLNLWPGIVVTKARGGFRLYLNGTPDSGNYFLDWTIGGATESEGGAATTYTLSGPVSGAISTASAFVVALPEGTSVEESVVITPDDLGDGGVFTPTSVELSSDLPSANFTYTPASYGVKTIATTNGGFLDDPDVLMFTSVVGTYLFSGPSTGGVGAESTDFTVELPSGGVALSTITVTPSEVGIESGVFDPVSVVLTTASPSAAFTFTPALTGATTITVNNNRDLTDPADLPYMVTFNPDSIAGLVGWWKADSLALSDGATVTSWADSSGNGNDGTGVSTPVYKISILGGFPVVRFVSVESDYFTIPAISASPPYTIISVMRLSVGGFIVGSLATSSSLGYGPSADALRHLAFNDGSYTYTGTTDLGFTFHLLTAVVPSLGGGTGYVDGTSETSAAAYAPSLTSFTTIGYVGGVGVSDGDIAEILIYDSALSTGDRTAVEDYLQSKYGL